MQGQPSKIRTKGQLAYLTFAPVVAYHDLPCVRTHACESKRRHVQVDINVQNKLDMKTVQQDVVWPQ